MINYVNVKKAIARIQRKIAKQGWIHTQGVKDILSDENDKDNISPEEMEIVEMAFWTGYQYAGVIATTAVIFKDSEGNDQVDIGKGAKGMKFDSPANGWDGSAV
jgi:alpha-amylase/alpha-mannosidase (GH57 family)